MKKHWSRSIRPIVEALEDRLTPAILPVTTFADVVNPSDGQLSLREAITRANATAERDTIVLQAGRYLIGLAGAGEDGNASGDFDVTNPLTIVGQGASATAIDGRQRDRLFEVLGTYNVRFSGMSLRNGGGSLNGGAVQAETANLRLDHCAVSGNRALRGGGINAETGNVVLVDCSVNRNVSRGQGGGINLGTGTLTLRSSAVRNNLAGGVGGGIRGNTATLTNCILSGNSSSLFGGGIQSGTVTLTHCTVRGNSARGDGGGIQASGVTLTDCTVSGNSSLQDGGGIDGTTVSLTNCTVSDNTSGDTGGGIAVSTQATLTSSTVRGNSAGGRGGGIWASSQATLTNSTLSGNFSASSGGGIQVNTATLTNSTLSGNTASTTGGGIHAATATLTNCTITLNSALEDGGGVFHDGIGMFSVRNTIVAQNDVSFNSTGPDVFGAFVSLGHNLIGDATGSSGFGASGDQVGTPDNPLDARLGSLGFNGGRTQTHALLPGSRAIDRGDNSDITIRIDQRGPGFSRIRDGDGNGSRIVDIGAFER